MVAFWRLCICNWESAFETKESVNACSNLHFKGRYDANLIESEKKRYLRMKIFCVSRASHSKMKMPAILSASSTVHWWNWTKKNEMHKYSELVLIYFNGLINDCILRKQVHNSVPHLKLATHLPIFDPRVRKRRNENAGSVQCYLSAHFILVCVSFQHMGCVNVCFFMFAIGAEL